MARREERAYSAYVSDEQRRQPGRPARELGESSRFQGTRPLALFASRDGLIERHAEPCRLPEIDLREAGELAAPQREVDRAEAVEELAGLVAAQRPGERHHRVVEREGIGLGVVCAEWTVPPWFRT